MYQSKSDIERNRLYITLKGRITAEESKKAAGQILEDLKAMKSGFDVITDISEFEPVTQKEAELLVGVHQALLEGGVNRIVRVIGDELKATVGKIQFERTSRQSNVAAENFNSIEEANRYLDG
jgi:cyclopropane fatty-acyl-phospholipid synthase-like methyltransferase